MFVLFGLSQRFQHFLCCGLYIRVAGLLGLLQMCFRLLHRAELRSLNGAEMLPAVAVVVVGGVPIRRKSQRGVVFLQCFCVAVRLVLKVVVQPVPCTQVKASVMVPGLTVTVQVGFPIGPKPVPGDMAADASASWGVEKLAVMAGVRVAAAVPALRLTV